MHSVREADEAERRQCMCLSEVHSCETHTKYSKHVYLGCEKIMIDTFHIVS
jgi:hypothetical protein